MRTGRDNLWARLVGRHIRGCGRSRRSKSIRAAGRRSVIGGNQSWHYGRRGTRYWRPDPRDKRRKQEDIGMEAMQSRPAGIL